MAPLVLLVGKNNTGKSYIASLLWGLLNFEETFLPSRDGIDHLPEWFKVLAEDDYDTSNARVEVTSEMFSAWVSRILRDRLTQTVGRVLSLNFAEIGALDFSLTGRLKKCVIQRSPMEEGESYSGRWSTTTVKRVPTIDFAIAKGTGSFTARSIFGAVATVFLSGRTVSASSDRAIYLPAGRTGLMLAFDALTTSALDSLGFGEPEVRTQLPLPMIRFLQALANGRRRRRGMTGYESIASFLEKHVLNGQIIHNEGEAPSSFAYKIEDEVELPLHAASSMVTELAPLLLLLRNQSFDRGLVFEEPEAHLHLAAQRIMARAIVRLVNMGVPVVVTTHSDTFLQELNILMQLHRHEKRDKLIEKFGYEIEDLLDPEDVRGYEFVPHGTRSSVHAAEIGEYGIVVPTLNDTLNDIADQLQTVLE